MSGEYTLFASNATPAVASAADANSVELGVKFVPAQSGQITGMRFYKGAANTGTHVGSLWSSTGTRLASVTFAGESASGWQTATFASAVPVTAGTTYVLSYLAPSGGYSYTKNFFATAWSNGLLSAPAGTNGVYLYGTGGFPTASGKGTNYWVDPIYHASHMQENLNMPENLNIFIPGLQSSYTPVTLPASPAPAPAGGVGTTAGAWDTAQNRDAAIATINALLTRVDQIEVKLKEIGIVA